MLTIPTAGLQPAAPPSFPQLPVMQAPRPYESLAQRNAASVLPLGPPRLPPAPDILGQIAAGAQTVGQLRNLLMPAPAQPLNVVVPAGSAAMPSMTTSGGATIGGGTMQIPASSFSIAPPALPQMGLLGRIAQGIFS
jgi:hypothetical protein